MVNLDEVFFQHQRWENAIDIAVDKGINKKLLRDLCSPESRIKLWHKLKNDKYIIENPHEAQIPKDNGEFRTVYVNEPLDRVTLSIVNQMIFDLCPELIHPTCKSYQQGIGCGKTVINSVTRIVKEISKMKSNKIGIKADLSKYFDSVAIEEIDKIFDYIDNKYGSSHIMKATRNYYHTNEVIDINKNIIEKYSSLRQGCAFAAFLADAVLYDIDEAISKLDVFYVRYSDDILIIGKDWKKGLELLNTMLVKKGLSLNPKKVEQLYKDKWFKFLGFTIKGNQISLSQARVKKFQKDIENLTIKNSSQDVNKIIHDVHHYLYYGDGEYSWATSVLPIMNVEADIIQLNNFVMDAIRAAVTGKHKIGGLGVVTTLPYSTILRGKGNNVKSNRQKIPHLNKYYTINCMRKNLLTSREAFNTLIRQM